MGCVRDARRPGVWTSARIASVQTGGAWVDDQAPVGDRVGHDIRLEEAVEEQTAAP